VTSPLPRFVDAFSQSESSWPFLLLTTRRSIATIICIEIAYLFMIECKTIGKL